MLRKALLLLALVLVCSGSAWAQVGGIQAQQTASNPLQLRITDGDVTSTLGTYTFKATNVSLTASATNYVYLDLTTTPPTLTVNTTGFPTSNYYAIATVTTNSKQITAMTDSRPSFNSASFSGSGSSGSFSSGYIDPTNAAYGVKANGNVIFDATLTSGSNVVTSASAKFITGPLPAVVGMRAVGSCCGAQGGNFKVGSQVLIGAASSCLIQSVDSDTQVTLTTGCNSSANQSNALFAWVTDDTNAWKLAITAAWGKAGHCKPIFAPGGLTGVSDSIGNTTTCKNEITNAANTGAFIGSWGGRTGSYFIILPEFVANAMTGGHCTGGAGGIGCMFSAQGIEVANLGFWGLENSPAGATNSFAL